MKEYYEKNKLTVIVTVGLIVGLALIAFKKRGEPASENRVLMDQNAKTMSDSIKRSIDQSLDGVIQEINTPSGFTFTQPPAATAVPQPTVK